MTARGKAAGAVLKVAAPEAAVAAKATGAGKDPRKSAPGSKAAQQRQQIEDVKARREPEHEDQADEPSSPAGGDSSGRPSSSAPFAGMQGPATGGGFALGLIVWALVRAYIGNPGQPSGTAGVKALVNAKLFNKVTATAATK